MDTNPPRFKNLKRKWVLFALFIILALVFCVQSLRDWVQGDIESRLIPATAVVFVPCFILLVIYTIRLIIRDTDRENCPKRR